MQISLYFAKKGQPDDIIRIKQSNWSPQNLWTLTQEEKVCGNVKHETLLNAQGILQQVSNILTLIQFDDIDPYDEIQLTCPGVPPVLIKQKNIYYVKDALLERIEITLAQKPLDYSK